jgi:hypothetical protein
MASLYGLALCLSVVHQRRAKSRYETGSFSARAINFANVARNAWRKFQPIIACT